MEICPRGHAAKGHTWPLSRLFWISMLFGQVLPSTVGGDVVRVFMMWRSDKRLRIAFNSVALERASMLLTLLLFVALQLSFLDSRVVVAQLIWIAVVPLLGGIIGLIALMSADHVLKYLGTCGWSELLPDYLRVLAKFIFRGRAGVCSLFA
jgi:hypothetical protein